MTTVPDPVVPGGVVPVTDGRSSRWDEHRANRREQLIDAAILAVKQYGTDVGMDQIAAAAEKSASAEKHMRVPPLRHTFEHARPLKLEQTGEDPQGAAKRGGAGARSTTIM